MEHYPVLDDQAKYRFYSDDDLSALHPLALLLRSRIRLEEAATTNRKINLSQGTPKSKQ
jgi:hypothetical protein